MKELPYFRFYTGEWIQGDISAEDYNLQGLFLNVCCYYWNQDCNLAKARLEKRFKNDFNLLKQLYEQKYIKILRNGQVSVKFLDEQYKQLLEKHEVLSKAGQKGGRSSAQARLKPRLKPRSSYKDKDKDKDKIRDSIKEFAPPTLIEFIQFFKDNGFPADMARKVFQGYKVADWHDSNGKQIKNWKQKICHVWFTDSNRKKFAAGQVPEKYPGVIPGARSNRIQTIKDIIKNENNEHNKR